MGEKSPMYAESWTNELVFCRRNNCFGQLSQPSTPPQWVWRKKMVYFLFSVSCKQTFMFIFSFALNPSSNALFSLVETGSLKKKKPFWDVSGAATLLNPSIWLTVEKAKQYSNWVDYPRRQCSPCSKLPFSSLKAWATMLSIPRFSEKCLNGPQSTQVSLVTMLVAASGINL